MTALPADLGARGARRAGQGGRGQPNSVEPVLWGPVPRGRALRSPGPWGVGSAARGEKGSVPITVGGRRYRAGPRLAVRLVSMVAAMAVAAFAGAFRQTVVLQQRAAAVRRELDRQRRYNQELERALQEASSPTSIERRARTTMGLVKPGEQVFEPVTLVGPDDPFRVPQR